MTAQDTQAVTSWDHRVGTWRVELPDADALLFVPAAEPGRPERRVTTLSAHTMRCVDSDRDRAILRAFLNLALQRLDDQEKDTHVAQ